MSAPVNEFEASRRQRTRRLAIVLALIAAGFYAAIIGVSILSGRH